MEEIIKRETSPLNNGKEMGSINGNIKEISLTLMG
jgi:hypothetical protein